MPLFGSTPFFITQRVTVVFAIDGTFNFPETRLSAPSGCIVLQGYTRWVSGPALIFATGFIPSGTYDIPHGSVKDWLFAGQGPGPATDVIGTGAVEVADLIILCTQATNIPADQASV